MRASLWAVMGMEVGIGFHVLDAKVISDASAEGEHLDAREPKRGLFTAVVSSARNALWTWRM